MIRIPLVDAAKIIKWSEENIPDCCLADDGREREMHVSVCFGFANDVQSDEVFDAVRKITAGNPIVLQLGNVSRFETNPEYDVIKIDVESESLSALHYALREVFGDRVTVTFPDFRAHLTLAYTKKGALKDLDGHGKFNGDIYLARDFVYSEPDSKHKSFMTILSESVNSLLQ